MLFNVLKRLRKRSKFSNSILKTKCHNPVTKSLVNTAQKSLGQHNLGMFAQIYWEILANHTSNNFKNNKPLKIPNSLLFLPLEGGA